MKTFYRFLVEQGMVSEDDILKVRLQQIAQTPSTAEIVCSKQLLSVTQQLAVLDKQVETGFEYREACQALGFWSEELGASLRKEIEDSRPSVCEFLLRSDVINATDLTKALDEYTLDVEDDVLAIKSAPAPAVTASTPVVAAPNPAPQAVPAQAKPAPAASQVSSNYSWKFAKIDRQLAKEYLDVLSTSKRDTLVGLVESLSSAANVAAILDLIVDELHIVKAVAEFIGAEVSSSIAEKLKNSVSKAQKDNVPITEELVSEMKFAVDAIFKCRDSIEANCSEKQFWDDGGMNAYERICQFEHNLSQQSAA